jgi:DNA-binding NarL/FixJ family response regulator
MIRVALADDESAVRTAFHTLLDSAPDIVVVGEAGDGYAAVALADRLRPDVIVMDVRMPRMDGIEATRRLMGGAARPRVLVLTMFAHDEYVFAALRAGASGFLLKDATRDQLHQAVRTVAAGDALLAPSATRALIAEFVRRDRATRLPDSELSALTAREREVFDLVAAGRSNAEIAADLWIGVETVKTHVARILGKLGLRDRVQLVVLAHRLGIRD